MAVLNIDTSVLRSSVKVAEQANSDLTEAARLLNMIVEHKDWICPERDKINEKIVSNKQTAQTIQENSSSFYTAITTSSQKFDDMEQDNKQRTNSVDDIISRISTVVPKISETVFGTGSDAAIDIVDLQGLAGSMEE
jgi:hypothetical protein